MDCKTCERRSNIGCQVFKEKPSNCWAYTTDKDWLRKVRQDVEKYRNRGDGEMITREVYKKAIKNGVQNLRY